MASGVLFNVSVAFAIVTGTGAGILSLLTWEIFRRTAFGAAIFALTFVMSTFILYHVVLLVLQSNSSNTQLLECSMYTCLFVLTILLIHYQRRMRARVSNRGETAWP